MSENLSEARPSRTFHMEVSFDGTAYHGWQRQSNGITVQ
jgi:tRNA U38,U39,U40 pseudouridine synthase TruA